MKLKKYQHWSAMVLVLAVFLGMECPKAPPDEPIDGVCCEGGGMFFPLGTVMDCHAAGGEVAEWSNCQSQILLNTLADLIASSDGAPLFRIRIERIGDSIAKVSLEQPTMWTEPAPLTVGLIGREYVGRDGATYIEVDSIGMSEGGRKVNARYLARAIELAQSALWWADAQLAAEIEGAE